MDVSAVHPEAGIMADCPGPNEFGEPRGLPLEDGLPQAELGLGGPRGLPLEDGLPQAE